MNLKLCMQIALIALSIANSTLCDLVAGLTPLPTTARLSDSNFIYTVNWCDCNYLAAGGYDENYGLVGIYQFDQATGTLSAPISVTTFGGDAFTVQWCPSSPSCQYLAVGGDDVTYSIGILQAYKFDSSIPSLETIGSQTGLGGQFITSIDWSSSCAYLAASDYVGIIQVFTFDTDTGLSTTFSPVIPTGNPINCVKWCDNNDYLAVIDDVSTLLIYTFDTSSGLTFAADHHSTSSYNFIGWCGNCGYIAAGGYNNSGGIIDIYKFDPTPTPHLSIVAYATIQLPDSGGTSAWSVYSLKWCQGCDNLAVSAVNNNSYDSVIQLYHFDTSAEQLTFINTYASSFSFYNNYYVIFTDNIDWCTDCAYLAASGADINGNGIIQLYKSTFVPPLPPSNLTAQKICHRFPTQVDIINQLSWDPVSGAVAYNVYAIQDATAALANIANSACCSRNKTGASSTVVALDSQNNQLTYTDVQIKTLLATVTTSPLCYSQHQICKGKQTTYYVTAINADGNESAPAIVIIQELIVSNTL